jgi:1,4-alpha-glucan branching enzyme
LYEKQFTGEGFEWINYSDHQNAVLSYIRKGNNPQENVIIVCNFTPVVWENYRIGIPKSGNLKEIFNSDSLVYGGSGVGNSGVLKVESSPYDGRDYSIELILPPLSVTVYSFE